MAEESQSFVNLMKEKKVSVGDSLILRDYDGIEIARGLVSALVRDPKEHVVVSWNGKDFQNEKQFFKAVVSQETERRNVKLSATTTQHLFIEKPSPVEKVIRSPEKMCRIRIVGPRQIPLKSIKAYYEKPNFVNVTSRSSVEWMRGLSPFYLGPCELHDGKFVSRFMENAWQFSKVFPGYESKETGEPAQKYWDWAKIGWESTKPIRFPMGKGKKPLYSWKGRKLGYVESKKEIYCPLYAKAAEKTDAYERLTKIYEENDELIIWDYDGYDYIAEGKTLEQCLNDPNKIMGHAFVLAMMLTNQRHWEDKK